MNKSSFLKNLNGKTPPDLNLPSFKRSVFEDKTKAFAKNLKKAGGEAIIISQENEIENEIKKLFPNAKKIASIYEYEIASVNPNLIKDPKELKDIEIAIVKGEFAVAENGAVFINEEKNRHRAVYSICKHLIIITDKNKIVNTMEEAYEKIDPKTLKYALFISGPSKTADIEQTLVIGAHGAKSTTVFLV